MTFEHRHTKIVATLGPATQSVEMLKKLIAEGIDIARINMAHGTHDWARTLIKNIREASSQVGREVGIMLDVKGPEIRTDGSDVDLNLEPGDLLEIHAKLVSAGNTVGPGHYRISVNYPSIAKDVKVGGPVGFDNGLIKTEVISKDENKIVTKVITQAVLKAGRRTHVNLPGVYVDLPAVTQKDKDDLKMGLEAGIDWVAQSFVRRAEDMQEMREYISSLGYSLPVMAKLEDQSAIKNLESIVAESDGIMIGRGDLGAEIPMEDLPIVQEQMVECCLRHAKPVIVATQMLESMITAPFPTRAETTDIAHAVWQKTDCVMLSGETTVGKYPLDCVQVLQKVAARVEGTQKIDYSELFVPQTDNEKMLLSAVVLAQDLECSGIVIFSHKGESARAIAALRPMGCPIYIFTDDLNVHRQINMMWGVEPFQIDFKQEPEKIIDQAIGAIKAKNYAHAGDKLVVLTNVIAGKKMVNSIQLRLVD